MATSPKSPTTEGANAPEPDVAEQTGKAGVQTKATAEASSDVGTVKYVGDAGVREISKADWKAAGIEHDTVTWDADNEYTVLKSLFSAEALELLRRDRGLKISN